MKKIFEAKDFLGQELKVGDTVVFMKVGMRDLCKGSLITVSKRQVMISFSGFPGTSFTKQFHNQVVKVVEQ